MVETEPKPDAPFPPENQEEFFISHQPKEAIQLLIEYYRPTREFISLLKLPLTAEIIKKIANSTPTLSQQREAKLAMEEKTQHCHPPFDLKAVSNSISDIVGSNLIHLIYLADRPLEAPQRRDLHSDLDKAIKATLALDEKITVFSQMITNSLQRSIKITIKRTSPFTQWRWVEFDQAMQEQESPTDISSKTTTG